MAITVSQLQAFKATDFSISSAGWTKWETAVTNHSKDLSVQVTGPLGKDWDGTAASSAQTALDTMHSDMSASATTINAVTKALTSAEAKITTAQKDLTTELGILTKLDWKWDDSGNVSPGYKLSPDQVANSKATADAAQTRIQAILKAADAADQEVATALQGLMPPNTGPGSDLSSNPGSNSGSSDNSGDPNAPGSTQVGPGNPTRDMALGQKMAAAKGWTGDQWTCLQKLWVKESGWNFQAKNPSSGAYGIPQSLPSDKMASAGSDWQTNPATQIKWGLDYIAGRYGTPCGAWAHETANNWY